MREFNTYLKVIWSKGNVIVQQEFKLAYYDVAVQNVSYNITEIKKNLDGFTCC